MQKDVIIVGGGLAGLTAAVMLARAGRRVRLLEKSEHVGGRAITQQKQGFAFNLGPHALYASGAAARVLKDLNIAWRGRKPALSGYALMRDQAETMPAGAVSLLTTGLFKLMEKWEAVQWLAKLPKLDTMALQSVTLQQWLDENIDHLPVRQLFEALVRVATYTNDPARQSAGTALQQVQMAVASGVYYLDGGWQSLVDALRAAALAADVDIVTGQRVKEIITEDDQVCGVTLANGDWFAARHVLLATAPATVAELTGSCAPAAWRQQLQQLIPVKAACLDVALARLPQPQAKFALGIDAPLYFSVHSATAQLAPNGGAMIHAAKYLPTGEHGTNAERELESMLDLLQSGWRECLVERRFLPEMTVSHALVTAAAKRPAVNVPAIRGLYVAGDWVGDEGQLADAALASASQVAQAILQSESL